MYSVFNLVIKIQAGGMGISEDQIIMLKVCTNCSFGSLQVQLEADFDCRGNLVLQDPLDPQGHRVNQAFPDTMAFRVDLEIQV
jgi:hypothetical protein